jgi:hypothetical protein
MNSGIALRNAIFENSESKVKVLLEAGANPNYEDTYYGSDGPNYKIPVFCFAFTSINVSPNICNLLVKAGANVDVTMETTGEIGPLLCHVVDGYCQVKPEPQVKINYLEKVRILIKSGVDINTICYGNNFTTPLIKSIRNQASFEVTKLLIESGANLFFRDNLGHTAFDYAEEYPEIEDIIKEKLHTITHINWRYGWENHIDFRHDGVYFRNTHILVFPVLYNLAVGFSINDIQTKYHLDEKVIRAAIMFASKMTYGLEHVSWNKLANSGSSISDFQHWSGYG